MEHNNDIKITRDFITLYLELEPYIYDYKVFRM